MQEFLSPFFYRFPVELEPVDNGEFLGTILCADSRTLTFQQPKESFQFRPMNSAGTMAHKMSAPAPRSINGLTLKTFAQSLISAKVPVMEHFESAASYNVPNNNTCMYFF